MDVFALGATLYRLVTGRVVGPAETDTPLGQLERIGRRLDGEAVDMSEVPPELCEAISRMIADAPADRPATMKDVRSMVAPFADEADLKSLIDTASVSVRHGGGSARHTARTGHTPETRPATERSRGGRRWIPVGLAGLAGWAGLLTLIVLQTQRGELVVESEIEGVRVEVLRDGKSHDDLTASVGAKSIKLWADRYQITVPESGDLIVQPDDIQIRRGETVIARITRRPGPGVANAARPATENATGETAADENAQPAVAEATYEGKTFSQWLTDFAREVALEPSQKAAEALTTMATVTDIPVLTDTLLDKASRTEFRDGAPHHSTLGGFEKWARMLPEESAGVLEQALLRRAGASLSNRQRLMTVRLLLSLCVLSESTLSDAAVHFLRQQRQISEDPWVRVTAHQALYRDAVAADALQAFDWDQFDDPDAGVAVHAALLFANSIEHESIDPTDRELADRLIRRMSRVYDQSKDPRVLKDALVAAATVAHVKRLASLDVVRTSATHIVNRLTGLLNDGGKDIDPKTLLPLSEFAIQWTIRFAQPGIERSLNEEYLRRVTKLSEVAQSPNTLRTLYDISRNLYRIESRPIVAGSPLMVTESLFQATGRLEAWDEQKAAERKTPTLILRQSGQLRDVYLMLTRPKAFVRNRFTGDQVSNRAEFQRPLPSVLSRTVFRRDGRWRTNHGFDFAPVNNDNFLGSPISKAVIIQETLGGDDSLRALLPAALASLAEYQATMKRELVSQVAMTEGMVMQVSVELSDELDVPRTFMAPHASHLRDPDPATRIAALYAFAMTGYGDDFGFDERLQQAAAELDPIWLPAVVNLAVENDSDALDTAIDRIAREGDFEALLLAWEVLPTTLSGDRRDRWLRQALTMPIDDRFDVKFETVSDGFFGAEKSQAIFLIDGKPLTGLKRAMEDVIRRPQMDKETVELLRQLKEQNLEKLSAMDRAAEKIRRGGEAVDVRAVLPDDVPALWMVAPYIATTDSTN